MAHIGAVLFNLMFCQVFHRNRLDDNTKKKKHTHIKNTISIHMVFIDEMKAVFTK